MKGGCWCGCRDRLSLVARMVGGATSPATPLAVRATHHRPAPAAAAAADSSVFPVGTHTSIGVWAAQRDGPLLSRGGGRRRGASPDDDVWVGLQHQVAPAQQQLLLILERHHLCGAHTSRDAEERGWFQTN